MGYFYLHEEEKYFNDWFIWYENVIYYLQLLAVYFNGVEGWEQVVCVTSSEEHFSKQVYVEFIDRGSWSLQYTAGCIQ